MKFEISATEAIFVARSDATQNKTQRIHVFLQFYMSIFIHSPPAWDAKTMLPWCDFFEWISGVYLNHPSFLNETVEMFDSQNS